MTATLGNYPLNSIVCTDALSLLRGLPDGSVNTIITDPPYGVGKVSAWRPVDERFPEIAGNNAIDAEWLPDAYRALSPVGALYSFANWQNVDEWKAAIRAAGFRVRNMLIWDKMQTGAGDTETCYAPEYEIILFCVKGRHLLRGARPSDVVHCPKVPPHELVHPYEKPVPLLEGLIRTSSDVGALVVDCFAGSGTTGVAAIRQGRRFVGSDTDAGYVALANKRLALPFTPYMFSEVSP